MQRIQRDENPVQGHLAQTIRVAGFKTAPASLLVAADEVIEQKFSDFGYWHKCEVLEFPLLRRCWGDDTDIV
jgi:hypothetical protein